MKKASYKTVGKALSLGFPSLVFWKLYNCIWKEITVMLILLFFESWAYYTLFFISFFVVACIFKLLQLTCFLLRWKKITAPARVNLRSSMSTSICSSSVSGRDSEACMWILNENISPVLCERIPPISTRGKSRGWQIVRESMTT